MRVMFWIYMAIAFISSCLQYLSLFHAPAKRLTIQSMTPAWILPTFQMLLSGVLASIIAPGQPPMQCLTVIVGGVTYLGFGWMVAFLMYAVYIHRLMQHGLPAPNLRPGMFIAVGPPSFTGLALIGLSQALPLVDGEGYFMDNTLAIKMLQTMADWASIFLWTLGFWFFCITLLAVLAGVRQMSFHMIWWALVFPNTALGLVTGRLGERLESEGISKHIRELKSAFLSIKTSANSFDHLYSGDRQCNDNPTRNNVDLRDRCTSAGSNPARDNDAR
jgi:tellurite resistance protein TehA-like permease